MAIQPEIAAETCKTYISTLINTLQKDFHALATTPAPQNIYYLASKPDTYLQKPVTKGEPVIYNVLEIANEIANKLSQDQRKPLDEVIIELKNEIEIAKGKNRLHLGYL